MSRIGRTCWAVCAGAALLLPALRVSASEQHLFSAQDLLSLNDIGGEFGAIAISPTGKEIAFEIQQADFASHTYNGKWYVMSLAHNGMPVEVASSGELILDTADTWGRVGGSRVNVTPMWSPDGKWIAYLRKTNGEVQVWRARIDGSLQEQLTHNDADVLSFQWNADGDAIVYDVGRSRASMRFSDAQEADVGYLLDDRFAPEYSPRPLWFACEQALWNIPQPATQRCVPTKWVATIGGSDRRATTDEESAAEFGNDRPPGVEIDRKIENLTWDKSTAGDGKHAAWLENTDPAKYPGFGAPRSLFVDGTRCGVAQCSGHLDALWWLNNEVVFHRREGHGLGIEALYAWNIKTKRVKLIYRLDGVLRDCAVGLSTLVCLHETPQTSRKIVSIDPANGRLRTVFDPNPQLNAFALGKVEKLEWHDAYRNETYGHLVYPPDFRPGERYPLVIVQYRSRGFLNGGVGREYPIYPLAAKGFLVLSFDRPEDRRLEALQKVDTLADLGASIAKEWKEGYTNLQALTALEAVLDKLTEQGLVDPSKVGITGFSNGAEIVDFALTHSNRFAAAAVSGNVSPVFYQLQVNESLRGLMRAMYGASNGQDLLNKWSAMSMAHRAREVHAALIIQVADRELITALPAFNALKETGKPVEAYVFPDEYHTKWQPQHKLAVAERSIDWFRFWLKDEEDPVISKTEQYVRWRALRLLQAADQRVTHTAKATSKKGSDCPNVE